MGNLVQKYKVLNNLKGTDQDLSDYMVQNHLKFRIARQNNSESIQTKIKNVVSGGSDVF